MKDYENVCLRRIVGMTFISVEPLAQSLLDLPLIELTTAASLVPIHQYYHVGLNAIS